MKYLGCSYYPEDLGIERVPADIELMKAAGMNMVRMGEFAWSKMEKRESEFDFSLFRETLRRFAEHGIEAMMCTPTAAPPAWLTHRYPDTLVVDPVGHRAMHGIRQQCCYNSPTFRRFSLRIADALSKALADCGNIAFWQIDNELGQRLHGTCSCENCQRDFRKFLKERHGSLDKLNRAWRNEFWSQDYTDWDEIFLAFPECLWSRSPQVIHFNYSVSRVIDSLRFYDKTIREYAQAQAAVIRKNIPGAKITTNGPMGVLDLQAIFANLDLAAGDFYWNNRNTAQMAERLARYRAYKKQEFLVAETGTGKDYLALPEGQKPARIDMWRSFAHGAMSYLVFRWRPAFGGQEQTSICPLSPAGEPRRTYQVVRNMFAEVNAVKTKLTNLSLPKAEAAILFDHHVENVYLRHNYGRSIDYDRLVGDAFAQLHQRNILADFIFPTDSLDGYKLLILPSQRVARPELSRNIADFIKAGGVVWAIGELNNADDNGNFTDRPCPEFLREAFGIALHTAGTIPPSTSIRVSGAINGTAVDSVSSASWIADIDCRGGATAALKYVDGYYAGQDAFTLNCYGRGRAYYQGVVNPGPELMEKIAAEVIGAAGIKFPENVPGGVEIIDRGAAVFIINSNARGVSFAYPTAGEALLGNFNPATKQVELDAFDVCIIKRK